MQLGALVGGEVFSRLWQSVQRAGQIVAGIAYRFQFANLAQHLSNLRLGLVAQVVLAHLFQEAGYLYLHVVGIVLLTLYLTIQMRELALVLFVHQTAHHTEHPLYTLAKLSRFLLSLQDGDFWRLHQVRLDVLKPELLLFGLRLLWQQQAHHALQLGNQSYQDGRVRHVETGVEHSENHGQARCLTANRRVVTYHPAYHIDEGIEHAQHPHDTKHIEQQMGQCRPASLCVGSESSEISRCRRTDVFAHHQGDT